MKIVRFMRDGSAVVHMAIGWLPVAFFMPKNTALLARQSGEQKFFTASFEKDDTMYQDNGINPKRSERWLVFVDASFSIQL